MTISPVMAACFINHQEIPCDVFYAEYGWYLVIPFLILGLLFLIKADWAIKVQKWWFKNFLGLKWSPSPIVFILLRIGGALFLFFALYFLYMMFLR